MARQTRAQLDEQVAKEIAALQPADSPFDVENTHRAADYKLRVLLRKLNCPKTAKAFEKLDLWYA